LHIVISFLTHADHVFLGLPRFLVPGTPNRVMELMHEVARCTCPYVPPKTPSAKNSRDLVYIQYPYITLVIIIIIIKQKTKKIIIIIIRFIKRLRPWLQRRWQQVSCGQ